MAESSSLSPAPPLLLALPEELLVEVLLKLPVESLVALRGVCKLFDTYISSKSFRRSHVQLWANRETEMKHVFLTRDFALDDKDDRVSRGKKLCSAFAKSVLDVRQPGNCRFLFQEAGHNLQFGGCCDGILCFYEEVSDAKKGWEWDLVIYICNPVLNECRVISRPAESMHRTKVCFVPDPARGDYRIIVVSVCFDRCFRSCKVYAFRLNESCWREMDTSKAGYVPNYCCKDYSEGSDLVVHNGCVYWITQYVTEAIILGGTHIMLSALDLDQESVREIVLPHHLRYETFMPSLPNMILLRYQGSLGICCSYAEKDSIECAKVCLMKEEENGGISWGEAVEFEFTVPCKLCGKLNVGWKTCGCFGRLICRIPVAPNSVGWLMFYDDDEKETAYFWSHNEESEESLGKFHIPLMSLCLSYYVPSLSYYVPSLVSVLPQEEE